MITRKMRLLLVVAHFVAIVSFVAIVMFSMETRMGPPTNNKNDSAVVTKNENDHYVPSNTSCFEPHKYFRHSRAPVSLPIINLGFPKAGTTSLTEYFQCGGLYVSHQHCLDLDAAQQQGKRRVVRYCAACIQNAISENNNTGTPRPLATCGNYSAYMQLDASFPPKFCYWPQVEALQQIHDEHPNATFLLNFRTTFSHWYDSVSHWSGLHNRIGRCMNEMMAESYTSSLATSNNKEKLEWFFCHHVERVRNFVLQHPSHALIEVDIERNDTGSYLNSVFGIHETCWGHKNANPQNTLDKN